MKIPSVNSLFQSLTVSRSSGNVSHWQTGQQFQATVLSSVENGLVSLRIGATILTAQIEFNVKIGEKLALEVLTPGDKPILQSLRNDQLKQLIDAAIRQTLPRQQSITQLVKDIDILLSQKQLTKLPENIQSALKQLLQSFPDKNNISQAEGIKQAFRQSGLFLEARLSGLEKAHSVNLNTDIKAGLLRLQSAIQQHFLKSPITTQSGTHSTSYNNPAVVTTQAQTGLVTPQTPLLIRQGQTFTAINQSVTRFNFLQNPANLTAALSQKPISSSPTTQNTLNPTATTAPITTGPSALSPQAIHATNIQGLPASLMNARHLLTTLTQTAATGQTELSTTQRTLNPSMPYFYHGMPFRMHAEQQETRPSERFSRLDSLTKILTLFLKDTDSSLARIQHSQLSQHLTEAEQKQSWLFEIPVKHRDSIDVFQFKLEKDTHNNNESGEDDNTGWTINIAFNLEPLGQIHSKVTIHQKKVSVIFWAEQQETANNFLQHMQTLQHDLEDSGLVVTHINCLQGKPPESKDGALNMGVVNEKA